MKNATQTDNVLMGNKQEEGRTTQIRNIPGQTNGTNVIMTDIVIVAKISFFDLFSMTKMMKMGWNLIGENTMFKLTKGKCESKFDIVIPMANGAVYAMYVKPCCAHD